jgi:flagellar basal body-associated protein FliL
MADYDDDRDDRNDRRNDRDDRNDDRSGRRDDRFDDRPRKKKSALPMILIILGVVGVLCAGVCGYAGYFFYSVGVGGQKAAESILAKVGSGDLTGAYADMSADYKATHTQVQFNTAMKDSKLTEYVSTTWSQVNSSNQVMTINGTVTLKTGGTTNVIAKLRLSPDLKTWQVDDLGDGIVKPMNAPKEKNDKPSTDEKN